VGIPPLIDLSTFNQGTSDVEFNASKIAGPDPILRYAASLRSAATQDAFLQPFDWTQGRLRMNPAAAGWFPAFDGRASFDSPNKAEGIGL
jgi:hypothetical protein